MESFIGKRCHSFKQLPVLIILFAIYFKIIFKPINELWLYWSSLYFSGNWRWYVTQGQSLRSMRVHVVQIRVSQYIWRKYSCATERCTGSTVQKNQTQNSFYVKFCNTISAMDGNYWMKWVPSFNSNYFYCKENEPLSAISYLQKVAQ